MTQDVRFAESPLVDDGHRDRLRSAIPTLISFALLFAVTIAGSLVVREVVDLVTWLAAPQ